MVDTAEAFHISDDKAGCRSSGNSLIASTKTKIFCQTSSAKPGSMITCVLQSLLLHNSIFKKSNFIATNGSNGNNFLHYIHISAESKSSPKYQR